MKKLLLITLAALNMIGFSASAQNLDYYAYLKNETIRLETLCNVTRLVPLRGPFEALVVSNLYSATSADYALLQNRINELKAMNCQARPQTVSQEIIQDIPASEFAGIASRYQQRGYNVQVATFDKSSGACGSSREYPKSAAVSLDPSATYCSIASKAE